MSLKETWQLEKQHRQQEIVERKQAVQNLLSEMEESRQLSAAEIRTNLDAFMQTLKHQTEEILINAASDRNLIAQQVKEIQADVQSYLYELEIQRQKRAEQLWQNLQVSRAERELEVQQLFHQFANFRVELQHYHQSIQEYVWGSDATAIPQSESSPSTPVASPITQSAASSPAKSEIATKPAATKTSQATSARSQKSSLPKTATKSSPSRPALISRSLAAKPATVPKASSKLPAKSTPPAQPTAADHEKAVYTFLHDSQGARLTQIESALNLNRFQTVDALRSLIKKGLITQRDRVYLLQESV
jgi:hypothetical protein